MKILHIITSLRTGGAEKLVSDLLPRLRDRGNSVELLVLDGTETGWLKQIEDLGIKVIKGRKGAINMWNPLNIFLIRKTVKEGKYDIIHTHNSPAQILTVWAGVKHLSKLVTTEHNTTNKRRNLKWFRRLDNKIYSAYDLVVCVSPKTRENLLNSIKIDPQKVLVILNGIDLSKFRKHEANIAPKSLPPKDKDTKIILMVGAFRKQKDQPTLIKAMKHLPENYNLWLAGGWKLRMKSEYLTRELGLEKKVFFLGERKDIPQLMNQADVTVLSTHYEGMSIASLECMTSGKPFIATDVPGVRELANGAAVLVPENNDKALAVAIKELIKDRKKASEVSKRCIERAREYDIERTLNAHISLYNTLCK
ncbi:MAG: glycosyltransferase [Erysipelotrichales bacterium]|nr:glycosyltransferase [Erysipelotrichales bacterium]